MLDLAVGYVKNKKMSSREAEKHFGIPRRTLLNKVQELHQKKIGAPTRLTEEEEKNIVKVAVATVEPGKSVSISDFGLLSCSNQEVTETQTSKKNNGVGAKKSKTTKKKTSITNQDNPENNDPVFDLFLDNTAIGQPINDKDETADIYNYLEEDILNDSNILLNLTCDFYKIDKLEVSDSKKGETVTKCILDEKTVIIDTNNFDEINEINDEPVHNENKVGTSCTLDKNGKIIAINDSDDIFSDNTHKFTVESEYQEQENVSRCILNEKTGVLQYTIATRVKQVINNKPVLRDKIKLTSSKGMYTETVTGPKKTRTFKNDTKIASDNICPNIVNILPRRSTSDYGSTQQIIDLNEKREELNANNLNIKKYKNTKHHEKLQDSKQNILTEINTSTNETKVILETGKNNGKENKTFKHTDLNKEINKCADTKQNTNRKSGKKITNQPKKKRKSNKSTIEPKTKPARRTYKRNISETSNSDINISTHSDSDICDIESDKSDKDIQSLNTKQPKTESMKDNKTTIATETEKPSSSYDDHLSEACSNINYAVGDIILVRYFFKKKVDYFVGKVIAKVGNDRVNASFFRRTGRNDNTKFIKTKKQEVEIIDCKNIVKTVNLLTINTNETEFVLDDDDDYLYFDY
ncbi:unnamed protein product [Parnassius apollo]|uniref:(apollo) hypothetical protein n=1 Tax=Parnassius apollo TaxID=110799 RepID=A0A8S3XNT7_PARAO|nr:unnamed protein product [Parnassius apollo]